MAGRVQKLIESFLSDITIVIPEQADGCIAVRDALGKDADAVIRGIVRHLGQHDEAIVARNESFLTGEDAEVIPGIQIGKYWVELSNTTKDTVWKYLNLMLLAGAKHVRALDRSAKLAHMEEASGTTDLSGTDITSEIAKRLRDPKVRDQVMETIRETMEAIPDETDEDVDPIERLKAVESLIGDLRGTQLGKIIEEIASDLSGDISPEALGLPAEADLKSMGPQDLIGLLAKPDLMKRVMGIVSKVGDNLNRRMESGDLDREALAREGQEVLAKSQDLLKSISPQAAKMLAAMNGGNGISARKMARAMKKMGGKDLAAAMSSIGGGGNPRTSSTRDRLRRKLAEREASRGSDGTHSTAQTPTPESVETTGEGTSTTLKKPSKKGAKKKGKKHR
jgi:hypothetical protein